MEGRTDYPIWYCANCGYRALIWEYWEAMREHRNNSEECTKPHVVNIIELFQEAR